MKCNHCAFSTTLPIPPSFIPTITTTSQCRRPRHSLPRKKALKRFAIESINRNNNSNEQGNDPSSSSPPPPPPPPRPEDIPPLFMNDMDDHFWDSTDASTVFSPLRPDEELLLRSKLPNRIAQFFIDRASDAARLRKPPTANTSAPLSNILADLPPDTPDWEDSMNAEFRDYVYVTTNTQPPSSTFRRRGSAVFGGGDGLPNADETDGLIGRPYINKNDGLDVIRPIENPDKVAKPRLVSLFVGQVDSIDEQASRLGYSLIAILAFWFLLKVVLAVISFFLSFTFSFFAIFALSAGIFVLFFFIRF